MSEQQQAIELEMRLSAIEYMITKMYAAFLVASNASEEKINAAFSDLLAGASAQKFPGFDPAQSDLVSAEWALAVERLLNAQKEMVARLRAKK